MAYTINLTDGQIFATIADGTVNTASSMVLVGKNYAGYGEFLDENFIHLLENGANTTPPSAPLTGQLWWDKSVGVMKAYNGSSWKTIGSASSSSTQPSSPVSGDLWFDTSKNQLFVYTTSPSAQWILVGPASSSGQGISGSIVETISDGTNDHVVVSIYVEDDRVAIVSKDATFTPSPAIDGFANIGPGINLSTDIANNLFRGTATDAQSLDGFEASDFMSAVGNTSTTGTVSVESEFGLFVGPSDQFNVSVNTSNSAVTIANQANNANIAFSVNIGGTPTTVMTINGANGTISGNQINANYADVAERFAADDVYHPGTVVELGGAAEITKVQGELSENVFGVISTRAAYLMNSQAGTDATHPPIAMTGRVPVRTVGRVKKGDRLVSAGNGLARAAQRGEATAFNVIGRALEDKNTLEEGMVEAIVATK